MSAINLLKVIGIILNKPLNLPKTHKFLTRASKILEMDILLLETLEKVDRLNY